MHQSSNHSKFQRMRRRLDLFRQKKEEQSVSHPLRACLPFLCATGVLMTTVVTAASCTLCYRVDAQGQSLAFFHDVATYDAAVSQAETRASKILETQYSLNQDLSVRATLAPKDQIESLSGVTGSLMESIPELEHVYTLSVDGTMVGAAQDPSVITQALNLVKERYTTPETRSLHIDSQVDIRYQYLPADTGESTAEEMAAALKNNLDFINTEPHMAAILQGLIVSMEEAGQDRTMIHSLKTGLFGPLAGLGDAIWWYTAMPIIASICCSLATQNNVLGPIFYILFWALTAIFSRIWFVRLGYNAGVNSIKFIGDNAAYISKAAGILGVMVVGGLIPSYVSFAFPETLVISSVSVQGIFDSIMPNILPLGFVFLLYWLFKKKNVNTMKLILLVIALSVVLSFLGIM